MYSIDSIIIFRVYDTNIRKIVTSKSHEIIKELLQIRNDDELVLKLTRTDKIGYIHHFYQQCYKGIIVENGMYITHSKNGLIESVNGDFFKVGNVDINIKLTEVEALNRAIKAIGAQKYKWQIDGEEQFIKKWKTTALPHITQKERK